VVTRKENKKRKQEKKTRKQEKEKIPKIVATFVYASSQGQCTHSARTKIPKIEATFVYASSQGQRTDSARTNSGHLRLCQQPRAAHTLCSDQCLNMW
jgi:hypothetical protein